MAGLVQFDLASAARVARVVRTVEDQGPRARSLGYDPAFGSPRRKVFMICTFTGPWPKDTPKVVTFMNQTQTPNTVSAANLFAAIGTAAIEPRACAIAREGTAWYLIAAEC